MSSSSPRATKAVRAPNSLGRKARASILAAATKLFAERGYLGVTIADVAAAAETSKPAVLYYFADKDTLWRVAVDELWAEVNQFYEERWPRLEPSRELMEEALRLFIEAALRWPAYVRIPFIEGASPSWRSEWLVERHFAAHVRTTDRVLRACQKVGALPPGNPSHYQALLTSTINVFVTQSAMWTQALGEKVDDPEFLRQHVDLALSLTFRSNTLANPD